MFELIAKLSIPKGICILLIIFGLVIAPYWFLFSFVHDVYKENNMVERIMLSICISLPCTLINYFALHYRSLWDKIITEITEIEETNNLKDFIEFGLISLATGFIFYLPNFISYLSGDPLSLKNAIRLMVFSEIAYVIGFNIGVSFEKTNLRKKKQTK